MIRKIKTGIYGGTFNPPHMGHVRAAEKFLSAVDLDELIIMPDFLPPHKIFEGKADPEDRLEMCELAFSHIDKAVISDLEIKRGGKSYTALTLEELSAIDRELYFLCGTDMFLSLEHWFSFEKIFKLAKICYVRRENDSAIDEDIKRAAQRYIEKYDAEIISIPLDVTEISSSNLRECLKNGETAKKFLPKGVFEYIIGNGLYR